LHVSARKLHMPNGMLKQVYFTPRQAPGPCLASVCLIKV